MCCVERNVEETQVVYVALEHGVAVVATLTELTRRAHIVAGTDHGAISPQSSVEVHVAGGCVVSHGEKEPGVQRCRVRVPPIHVGIDADEWIAACRARQADVNVRAGRVNGVEAALEQAHVVAHGEDLYPGGDAERAVEVDGRRKFEVAIVQVDGARANRILIVDKRVGARDERKRRAGYAVLDAIVECPPVDHIGGPASRNRRTAVDVFVDVDVRVDVLVWVR